MTRLFRNLVLIAAILALPMMLSACAATPRTDDGPAAVKPADSKTAAGAHARKCHCPEKD